MREQTQENEAEGAAGAERSKSREAPPVLETEWTEGRVLGKVFFKLHFIYLCMCAHVWATVHTWSSDDSFWELFLSCHVNPSLIKAPAISPFLPADHLYPAIPLYSSLPQWPLLLS